MYISEKEKIKLQERGIKLVREIAWKGRLRKQDSLVTRLPMQSGGQAGLELFFINNCMCKYQGERKTAYVKIPKEKQIYFHCV